MEPVSHCKRKRLLHMKSWSQAIHACSFCKTQSSKKLLKWNTYGIHLTSYNTQKNVRNRPLSTSIDLDLSWPGWAFTLKSFTSFLLLWIVEDGLLHTTTKQGSEEAPPNNQIQPDKRNCQKSTKSNLVFRLQTLPRTASNPTVHT